MVTPEGLLPSRKITDSYDGRVCDETISSKIQANSTPRLLKTCSIWTIRCFAGFIGHHVAGTAYRISFRECAPICATESLLRVPPELAC